MTAFTDATRIWQRRALLAAVALSAVAIVPTAIKPFMLPKVTAMVVAMLVSLALVLARWAWTRESAWPHSATALAAVGFAAAASVTALLAPRPWDALLGTYDRYTGLAAYLSYVVVFLTVLATWSERLLAQLWKGLLLTLAVVVFYGAAQAFGLDPIGWTNVNLGVAFSTMGNVDFASAWCGAVAVVALATVMEGKAGRGWRWLAALLLPSTLAYVLATGTTQGSVVMAVSLLWGATVIWPVYEARVPKARGLVRRVTRPSHRWLWLSAVGALAAVCAVLTAPLMRAQLDQALVERPSFWSAAWRIFVDNPLVGSGLSTYADLFPAYRPVEHAVTYGDLTADVPHSVPLAMFSNGGLLLGGAYAAFVAAVGWVLLRGIRRGPSDRERLLLGAFGGIWLGYQAQSLISVDVPPLALLHWLSAGVIVAVAAPPQWLTVKLPGSAPARVVDKRGRKRGPVVIPLSTRLLQAAVATACALAIWISFYPLRADMVAANAAPFIGQGKQERAATTFLRAAELNPAEGSYALGAARAYESAGDFRAALEAAEMAAARSPGDPTYAIFAGWYADKAGDERAAEEWYLEAASRAPGHPETLVQVAEYLAESGHASEARVYVARVLHLEPANVRALALQQELEPVSGTGQ